MLNVRRALGLTFSLRDSAEIDANQLLRGSAPIRSLPILYAASPLTELSYEIEQHDFELICRIPEGDWSRVADLVAAHGTNETDLIGFARKGLLVSDSSNPELVELMQRDALLRQVPWSEYSRLSHFMTKWSDDFLQKAREEWRERDMPSTFTDFERRFGPALPPLVTYPSSTERILLPLIKKKQSLFRLLIRRRTTRSFDRRRNLLKKDFSVILYYVFGCHGYRKMSETLTVLKKTSPSGGALHPIEIYPLVVKAEGIDPGVYHYDLSQHSLDLIKKLTAANARDAALRTVSDQAGLAGAQVIFILVARFGRHFWKYRNHPKAYKVLSMEAGHLSQTLYVVATELGLGVFVTGAINDKYAESLLGIDGVNEGVIAVCGCGVPNQSDPRRFNRTPFVPRKTKLPSY